MFEPSAVSQETEGVCRKLPEAKRRARRSFGFFLIALLGCGNGTTTTTNNANPGAVSDGDSGPVVTHDAGNVIADTGVPIEDAGPEIVNQVAGVVVTTLAGSNIVGSQDGAGSAAGFNNPVGVALTADGSLFVTEYEGSRVRRLTSDGTTSSYPSPGGFVGAFALVLAPQGQMFVQTDFDSTGVKSNASGTIWSASIAAGVSSTMVSGMGRPRGLAMLSDDTMVVTDRMRHTVSLIKVTSPTPALLTGAPDAPGATDGPAGTARFNGPIGVVVLADKSILVADSGNHAIRRVQADGTVSTFAGSGKDGASDGPSATARFSCPLALAADAQGVVYVSDGCSNRRIRRISNGLVETVAGSVAGFGDGPGDTAKFYGQEGIAVSADGHVVYVADGNLGDGTAFHRIRKITIP